PVCDRNPIQTSEAFYATGAASDRHWAVSFNADALWSRRVEAESECQRTDDKCSVADFHAGHVLGVFRHYAARDSALRPNSSLSGAGGSANRKLIAAVTAALRCSWRERLVPSVDRTTVRRARS